MYNNERIKFKLRRVELNAVFLGKFSPIPWIFLFITGCFLNRIFEKYSLLELLKPHRTRITEWLGRHSLLVYVIHQPIIYAVCFIIFSGRIS